MKTMTETTTETTTEATRVERVTVSRAYLFSEGRSERVLADSRGRVYDRAAGWIEPAGTVVLAPGEVYERWGDVPVAWCGYVPYFR